MTNVRILVPLAALALATACNPYDPKLGYEPFQCGDSEPRCPLDYTCVTSADGTGVCQQTGVEMPDAGDETGDDSCNDDQAVEPNNTVEQAFDTGIPDARASFEVVGLAICPSSDIDMFSFQVGANGTNAVAEITYRSVRGELHLDILNMSGTSIMSGTLVEDEEQTDTLRAQVANLPVGTFFVRIQGADDVQNNYDRLSLVTTPP
jgi:hypothetical protein